MLPCPQCGKPQPLDAANCADCGQRLATSESNPFGTLDPSNVLIPQSPAGGAGSDGEFASPTDTVSNNPVSTSAPPDTGGSDERTSDERTSDAAADSPFGTMQPPGGIGSPLTRPDQVTQSGQGSDNAQGSLPDLPSLAPGSGKGSTVVDTSVGTTSSENVNQPAAASADDTAKSILGDPATATAADPAMLLPGLDNMLRPAATIQLPLGSNPLGPAIPANPSAKTVSKVEGTKTATDETPGQVADPSAGTFTEEQSPGSKFAQMLASVAASDRGGQSTIEGESGVAPSRDSLPPVPKRVVSVPGKGDLVDADYELLEEIGSGAMGTIYAARQKGVDRTVALKTIKDDVEQNHENIEKFLYEAQITGDLDHPNIVPIHELGAGVDGTLFYSMKLVKGTPWQDVISNKSVDENLDILMKVADALSFAHSRGVIHRDIKPENVMLGDYGEVLLMDWGLAVNLNKQSNFSFGGTPAYMAPEMAYHLVPQITFTSDVYLLGAVLYQIVSDCPPHPGESAQSCLEAAARNELNPAVRQDGLTAIAVQAMATHPNQRYASVGQFQEAIRQYRRHAESVTMTRRAQEALQVAQRDGDYDAFSRSIFGFQDAIDLWPENETAVQGLAHSRMEFGRHALEDNNLQLAIRVLDPNVPAEAEYLDEARKRLRVERAKDRRMKILRSSFAIVILISCAGLSVLALFANTKRLEAVDSKTEADIARGKAEAEREKTAEALGKAEKLTVDLTEEQGKVREALGKEKKLNEEKETLIETLDGANKDLMRQGTELAEAKGRAEASQVRAEANLADALNGTYQSQLGLVFAQLENADLGRATATLTSIVNEDGQGGIQKQWLDYAKAEDDGSGDTLKSDAPDLTNWIYNRADLLTNRDLIYDDLAGPALAVASSSDPENQVIAIAQKDQSIVFVGRNQETRKLVKIDATVKFDHPITAIEVSPDGQAVACLVAVAEGKNSVYGWRVGDQPTALDTKSYSQIYFTRDGAELWALRFDDAGIHKWTRAVNGGIGTALPKSDKAGVGAACTKMMAVSSDMKSFIFCPSRTRRSGHTHIRLFSNVFRMTSGIAWDDVSNSANELTVLVLEPDGGHFLMGFDDGTIVRCNLPRQSDEELRKRTPLADALFAPMRLKPNPHFSAIHTIRFSNLRNGSSDKPIMLTSSQQTDIHRWVKSEIDMGWEPLQTVLGHSNSVVGATLSADGTRGISVDNEGHILDWDFAEQERRQLEVLSKGYERTVFTKRGGDRSISMDGNGVLWRRNSSTNDGIRIPSFFGHTPDVNIYTTVATPDRKSIVTAASLANPQVYTPTASDTPVIEVCVWDGEGLFLSRFNIANESASPTLSLSADGKWLAVSGSPTSVWNVETKSEHWRAKTSVDTDVISKNVAISPKRTRVAYHGPHNISVVDFGSNQIIKQLSEDNPDSEFDQIAWSQDGDRLFVLDTSGVVIQRNVDDLAETANAKCTKPPPGGSSWRSHLVVQNGEQSSQHVSVIYYYRNAFRTMHTSFAFGTDSSSVLLDTEEHKAWRMILPNGAVSDYAPEMATAISLMKLASPTLPFVMQDGDVYQLSTTAPRGLSFARTECQSGSSDDQLKQFASLHTNGSVWICQADADNLQWKPFHPLVQFDSIAVSPTGKYLATIDRTIDRTIEQAKDQRRVRVWNLLSDEKLFESQTTGAFCWLHGEDQLVFVDAKNQSQLFDVQKNKSVALKIQLPADTVQLIPFTEKLRVPKVNRRYLISREIKPSGNHELAWHRIDAEEPIEPGNEGPQEANEKRASFRVSIPDLTEVTTSPVEGLLVTGTGEGSTTIWFCSPSVDRGKPREMLNLRGHMGASLTSIQFDVTGSALITSDDKLRNYVWHSGRK